MRCLFVAALATCLTGQISQALAYSCNNNYYAIRSGTSCIRHPAVRSTRSAPRSAAMAASAFQSITVGRAPFTAESPIGIELARTAGFHCHTIGARLRRRPQSVQAELDQASSEQATTASGQDQRLTKSDSDKGAAIIPIDALPRNN